MDLLSRTPPRADHRLHYGPGESQFGDLWLPEGVPIHPAPVVVFFHGGWWRSGYDLAYGGHLAAALKAAGMAVWSVEYRRVGQSGGGWPGTFQDVAAGFDHLAILSRTYALDLTRIVALGHSAGGHLAFWLAGRHHIEPQSILHTPQPRLPLHGVVSLAGAVDLRLILDLAGYFTFAHDKREVWNLMGGRPNEVSERYRAGNPGDLLPLGARQYLVQGSADDQIPPRLPQRWAEQARRLGDEIAVHIIPGADHFDVVDPQSAAWPAVLAAVQEAFR